MSTNRINYIKIGSFIISGIILTVVLIVFFGAKFFSTKQIYIETYFNTSVQGLSEGSSVEYLGVNIGSVKKITTLPLAYNVKLNNINKRARRYVYVLMKINSNFFTDTGNIKKAIKTDVSDGLRVQLSLQSVTGTTYLELVYLNPKNYPALEANWKLKNFYIPSAPSLLSYLKNKALSMMDNMQKLSISANNLFTQTNNQIGNILDNMQNTSENLNKFMEKLNDFPAFKLLFSKNPPKFK